MFSWFALTIPADDRKYEIYGLASSSEIQLGRVRQLEMKLLYLWESRRQDGLHAILSKHPSNSHPSARRQNDRATPNQPKTQQIPNIVFLYLFASFGRLPKS